MRKVMTACVPFIVLLAAWVAASQAVRFTDALNSAVLVIPFVIAGLAIFMSIRYQNSSSFFFVCFILLSYILIKFSSAKDAMIVEAVTEISILIPINAVWLAFIKERGIFTRYGANKAIIIAVQFIWILVNILIKGKAAVGRLNPESVIALQAPAIVLYVLAIGFLLANYVLKGNHMHLVFISVLISIYIALYFAHNPIVIAIFLTSAFVMIVAALFEVLHSLAFYDILTGVFTRRALEQELAKLGNKYSIAMADIDHFKRINDKYGHDVGDEVLKMVASIVDKVSGRFKTFRYGGEEFVIILQGQGCTESMPLLERIRKAVECRPFIVRSENRPKKKPDKITGDSKGKGHINITISIGVAQRTESVRNARDVIKKADEALYKSKCGGRNRISM